MYYYIVDFPDSLTAARTAQRLQELITPMGISGEVAVANPARSAEELTYMGLDKGYTTIVAVGGEELVTTIATILLNEQREKVAFGVIPFQAGALIADIIGVGNNDLRGAAEVIKQRHLDLIDVVQIGTKRFMITEAYIVAPRRIKIILDIDQNLHAELEADYAHIAHDLTLTLQPREPQTMWRKTLSLVGVRQDHEHAGSRFHGKQIRIVAHEPLPVLVAGQVVAKTPTTFTRLPAALKVITARAILPQKTINDFMVKNSSAESTPAPEAPASRP